MIAVDSAAAERRAHSLSVVFPAFNEAANLPAVIAQAISSVSQVVPKFEILIVDDGSSDETIEICNRLAAEHQNVRVIRHPRNRGYGATLRSGFAAAECDLVFFTDADGQFRFDELGDFVAKIDAFDMVIGYRRQRQDRWYRLLNSRVGNWLARTLLNVRVRDINCAYKLFHRDLLQRLPLTSNGAMINTELLALAARAGWTFHELPVNHYPREFGTATGANLLVILRTFAEYFALKRRLAKR
jgi:glycosyltransferase involved in cell wall biosynthesis